MSARVRGLVLSGAAAAILVILLLNVVWPIRTEARDEADWMWVGGLMAFSVAAALVLSHRPGNRVGWALGMTALSAGAIFLLTWYAATFLDGSLSRHAEALARVPAGGQFAGLIALLYLFPTGKPASVWAGRALVGFLAFMVVLAALFLLSPTPLAVTGRDNPLGVLPQWATHTSSRAEAVILLFMAVGVWSLVSRWRSAGATERAQLKWFLLGAMFTVFVLATTFISPDESSGHSSADVLTGLVVLAAFWSLPAAVVIAILRHDLYDIDRVMSRTLSYALLTAGLGATYFGLVVGLQTLLRPLSGGSDFAIVVTTLVVAALFLPVRSRIQRAVDRRFYRRAYDAARTIEAFSTRLREQADLDTLRDEILAVIDETMQPTRTTLWLQETEDQSG